MLSSSIDIGVLFACMPSFVSFITFHFLLEDMRQHIVTILLFWCIMGRASMAVGEGLGEAT